MQWAWCCVLILAVKEPAFWASNCAWNRWKEHDLQFWKKKNDWKHCWCNIEFVSCPHHWLFFFTYSFLYFTLMHTCSIWNSRNVKILSLCWPRHIKQEGHFISFYWINCTLYFQECNTYLIPFEFIRAQLVHPFPSHHMDLWDKEDAMVHEPWIGLDVVVSKSILTWNEAAAQQWGWGVRILKPGHLGRVSLNVFFRWVLYPARCCPVLWLDQKINHACWRVWKWSDEWWKWVALHLN